MNIYNPTIALESFQFTGSEYWYKHWLGIVFTDGVKWLYETLQCLWLIDDIAIFSRKLWKKEFFISAFYRQNKKYAVLELTDGNNNLLLSKRYDFSDLKIDSEAFAATELKPFLSLFLVYDDYLKAYVLMLPSEY